MSQSKPTTKECPKCGNTDLVELETENKKVCVDCHTFISWFLDEGQKPRQ